MSNHNESRGRSAQRAAKARRRVWLAEGLSREDRPDETRRAIKKEQGNG